MLLKSKLSFLASEMGLALLAQIMSDPREDLKISNSPLMRQLEVFHRVALLEQRALRMKGRRKSSHAHELLFTSLGLQQMTSETLSRYKATRLPSGLKRVADLCCGLGGDTFYLPESIFVVGVDKSWEALLGFRHNVGLFRSVQAIQADVERFSGPIDGILLDPARRSSSNPNSRDFDLEPEPGWESILNLVRRFRNSVLKLGPGISLPDELAEYEREYLGLKDECSELTVRTGEWGKPGMVRAVELPSETMIEAKASDLEDSFERVEEPGSFIYEPVKCVVRAHLFGVLAQQFGLWQLDARIAYLSGNQRVDSPLLKRYRMVQELPMDEALLRSEIAKHEVGLLEIKKRGIDITPEDWRRKLKPKGPNEATLIFTRLQGKARVLWVHAEKENVL